MKSPCLMLFNNALANRPAGIDFSAGIEPAALCKGPHWQILSQNTLQGHNGSLKSG